MPNKQKNNGGNGNAVAKPGAGSAVPPQCTCKCPICLLPLLEPVATECGHVYCQVCLNQVIITMDYPRCPVCRSHIQSYKKFN